MESRSAIISSEKNNKISIKIIPGHFATTHSHVNYYIDMTSITNMANRAKTAALELSREYLNSTLIDTIVCMDGCEIIGAFLAEQLTQSGIPAINSGKDVSVITPEYNTNGQMIFRDNIQSLIWGNNVLLLIASATTGKTILRSMDCIHYYGGNIAGISAIFSAISELDGIKINMLFTSDDLPDYRTYKFHDCPDCNEKRKIDAIVNSFGYTKI